MFLSPPTRRAAAVEAPSIVLLLEDTRTTVPPFDLSHCTTIHRTTHIHSHSMHHTCRADYCTSMRRGRRDEGKIIAHTIFIHFGFFRFGPPSLEQDHLYFYFYYILQSRGYSNSTLRE